MLLIAHPQFRPIISTSFSGILRDRLGKLAPVRRLQLSGAAGATNSAPTRQRRSKSQLLGRRIESAMRYLPPVIMWLCRGSRQEDLTGLRVAPCLARSEAAGWVAVDLSCQPWPR